MTNSNLHPVRFTREQVDFIRHMMAEKGSDFWEEECADLSDTISAYSVCPTCNGTGVGRCVDDPCPDCIEQGKCPMCLFPLTEKARYGGYGKPMTIDEFNEMVEARGTCPVCYQAFNRLEKYGQYPGEESVGITKMMLRDFSIWLQEEKDLEICKQGQEIVEVGDWGYERLYHPVASIEDLLDEYLSLP